MIKSVLTNAVANNEEGDETGPLARFAAIGAKTYLIHGRPGLALEMIELGRQLAPMHPQLDYLERLAQELVRQAEAHQAASQGAPGTQ